MNAKGEYVSVVGGVHACYQNTAGQVHESPEQKKKREESRYAIAEAVEEHATLTDLALFAEQVSEKMRLDIFDKDEDALRIQPDLEPTIGLCAHCGVVGPLVGKDCPECVRKLENA